MSRERGDIEYTGPGYAAYLQEWNRGPSPPSRQGDRMTDNNEEHWRALAGRLDSANISLKAERDRYRAALAKLRGLLHHPNLQIGPVLCDRAIASEGIDPSEFDK